jgi:hypothetical protein
VGINRVKFVDMARQAIPEGREDTRYKKDEACGEGSFRPGLERKSDRLSGNLGWRKPGGADIKEGFCIPILGPILVLPSAKRLPQPKERKSIDVSVD